MRSLDQIEYEQLNPRNRMLELCEQQISLQKQSIAHSPKMNVVSLNGQWEMVQDGNTDRVYGIWENVIPATVPGSVHAALIEAGKIPDPVVGKNDCYAREKSTHFWWLRKTFSRPENMKRVRLSFGGVCDRCTVWLNGQLLGCHQGMFGGPEYEITEFLQDENTLMVMLYPAPCRRTLRKGELRPFYEGTNVGWLDTTVFNCVYGWHYAEIPALGIWRSVELQEIPEIEICSPFITTKNLNGEMSLYAEFEGPEGGFSGELQIAVAPLNFEGESYTAAVKVQSNSMHHKMRMSFTIPDVKLWWPNDLGEHNLYQLTLTLKKEDAVLDRKEQSFGVRTIEMRPYMGQASEDTYNWQFVVNGQEIFVKGANWCTLDFAMRFTKEKYQRFLSLAQQQHIQLLRAWGGGIPETEEFYDYCDRYGIMVLQEFATAWDSQKVQPAQVLRDGVKRSILRLRNRASLCMWCGGNESDNPTDAAMDMIGRLAYELDGSRPFHRNDPWGGSSHNYKVYWSQYDFDYNLSYTAPFIGEFGFASSPNKESVQKYCSEEDFKVWPPIPDGNVEYHTPVFNRKRDMEILHHYIPEFLPDESLDNLILSTQLCQTTTLRHTLELARSRRPEATGIVYYKMTDVFPAVSWSTIDWFGVPKSSYYFVQDSFEPLHACVLFKTLKPRGEKQILPVYILDDVKSLSGCDWQVVCKIYDKELVAKEVSVWNGHDTVGFVKEIGKIEISESLAASNPLYVTVELRKNGKLVGRTFYWLNFSDETGCMFQVPKTKLSMEMKEGKAVITNQGNVPAIGVHFNCADVSDQFVTEDNYFWMESGESVEIAVNMENVGITAWNAES